MRNVRRQSFARQDGETWYEHNGYKIRLERRGPATAYEVFKDGTEQMKGIESENEQRVFELLVCRLR